MDIKAGLPISMLDTKGFSPLASGEKSSPGKPGDDFSKKLEPSPSPIDKQFDKPKASSDPVQNAKTSPELARESKIDSKVARRSDEYQSKNGKPDEKKLTRDEAMRAFLSRMEDELGVDPEQVLQAFAKLDVDMLMASPEASASSFLDNLELSTEDREKAMGLYSQLLTWRTTAGLSENLGAQGQQAQMSVLSPDQIQKRERLEQINLMSDRFFMNGDYSRGAKLANTPNAMKAYSQFQEVPTAMSDKTSGLDISGMEPVVDEQIEGMATGQDLAKSLGKVTEQMGRQLDAGPATDAANTPINLESVKKGLTNGTEKLSADDNLAQNLIKPNINPNIENMNLEQAGFNKNLEFQAKASLESANQTSTPQQVIGGLNLNSTESDTDSDDSLDQGGDDLGIQDISNQGQKISGDKTFVINSPKPTDVQMSENIRQIINGAQIMVKDGGGEMKINMNPDGMGEVNLKVHVQNGEVRVEMLTSSDETKKLLEKGLADLKSSLQAHKLNVEHVKIETADRASEQMMQSRQEAAERGFQQRFLHDFRDQNASRNSQALGIGSARPMSSQTSDAASNDSESASRRRRLERRLDLVA